MEPWVDWAFRALSVAVIGVFWFEVRNNTKTLWEFMLRVEKEFITQEDFKGARESIHVIRDWVNVEKGKELVRSEFNTSGGGVDRRKP